MNKTSFARHELYDLVWSEPMQTLADKYGISGRGLAKACERAGIPVPERGYWNKLTAGKPVVKASLPLRGFGKTNRVTIGDTYRWGNGWYISDEAALTCAIPPEPVFETEIETVRARATALVAKAPLPKTMTKPHRLIAKLLTEDEARRQKKLASTYSWDEPIFDNPFERRRLKILNGLLTCLEACGMKPSVRGKQGREVAVTVGDQYIPIFLDSVNNEKQIDRELAGYGFSARGAQDKMKLALAHMHSRNSASKTWQDTEDKKLEDQLQEIAIGIIVAGEETYRTDEIRHREYLIRRKADAEEAERKRQIEAERKRREHQVRLEKQRVDHLLGQAHALHQAGQIRAYVQAVQAANNQAREPMTGAELESWTAWALEQADRIDPITSGDYKKRPKEKDLEI